MDKQIADFPIQLKPYEIEVYINGSPSEGYARLARQVLIDASKELDLAQVFYLVIITRTLINPYEIINGKYFGRCQMGHTRYFTLDGTLLQGRRQRALVEQAWQEHLRNDKELIEHLTEKNKDEVVLRLQTYAKHLKDHDRLDLLNRILQDTGVNTLKEIALTFVELLALKVKVKDT